MFIVCLEELRLALIFALHDLGNRSPKHTKFLFFLFIGTLQKPNKIAISI